MKEAYGKQSEKAQPKFSKALQSQRKINQAKQGTQIKKLSEKLRKNKKKKGHKDRQER